ncbi:MAG TPA: energy transducer TonB [Balneolaceae bacterium]|nr:energy transducer TonB [Balneolaceae bacterium]
MTNRKKPSADLKRYYTLFLQLGLIASIGIFTLAVKADISGEKPVKYEPDIQETIKIEETIQTNPIKTPPPPPRPPVPVEVPEDEIIEDVDIDFHFDYNQDDRLIMPPPSQKDEESEEKIFEVVEQMPQLIGGMASIQNNIDYPEIARRAGIEGRVYVQFVVNERGDVEDPRVVRGIGGGADEEALRAVSQAKFRPGLQRGRPVSVRFTVPVVFRLQN